MSLCISCQRELNLRGLDQVAMGHCNSEFECWTLRQLWPQEMDHHFSCQRKIGVLAELNSRV